MTTLRCTSYECQAQRQFWWWTGSSMQWTNAAIAQPLTLVKPAETLALGWLNSNERQKRAISSITLLNTIYKKKKIIKQNNKQNAKKQKTKQGTIPSAEEIQLLLCKAMTSAQVVEGSVKNSPFQNFTHHGRSFSKVQKNKKNKNPQLERGWNHCGAVEENKTR